MTDPLPREHAWLTPLELVVLGAIWGASFLFMRVAADDFGAIALVEVRLGLGALVLFPFLWGARAKFPRSLWPKLALIGAINSALPFILFAWAAQRAPAGIGAIANAMTVPFTTLIAFLFFGERIGVWRSIALAIGFAGVVVLASATLGCAALLTLPFAVAQWPRTSIPLESWASGAALGVLCTGLAFVAYYRLIARIGASRTSTVTYLIPLFGVVWAWLILGEAVTSSMAVAGAMILGSVAIAQRAGKT